MTRIQRSDGRVALQVEGTLSGPWVRELQSACEMAMAEQTLPLALDLLGVTFLDREGASLLVALDREHRVELLYASPFVREVLGRGAP